jgi:K+-sensing histidine kinase KdpD
MVSVRKENDVQNASSPHLGLGLYIANIIMTFHKGQLSLSNRKDSTGVVVSARFPLM